MKAIILTRVSTIYQEIDEQRNELIELAKYDGFKEKDLIIIEGVGASAIKLNDLYLQQMDELYHTIDTNDIAALYAWEISRIGRNEEILMHFKNYLIERKIQLVIKNPSLRLLNSNGTTNGGVELAFSLFATMSKQEMEVKKERFARSKAKAKREGKYIGGRIKLGYCLDKDKRFEIEEDSASVVRNIFNLYVKDQRSCLSIFNHYVALGIFNNRTRKSDGGHYIAHILKDKAYIGDGIYPRIIDDEVFLRAQDKLAMNKQNHKTKDIYFGTGLLKDKVTGIAYSAHRGTTQYGLRINGKYTSLNINYVDFAIWWSAFQLLAFRTDDLPTQEYEDKISENNIKIANKQSQIEELKAQIDRAIEMNIRVPEHYPTEKLDKTIKQCENSISRLNNEILNLTTDNNRMKDFIDEAQNKAVMYKSDGDYTDEMKKEVINDLIDHIEITQTDARAFELKVFNKIGYLDNSFWKYESVGNTVKLIWVVDGAELDLSMNAKMNKRFERKKY